MNLRYRVELSAEERAELEKLLSAGQHPARKLKRAQILLATDAGVSDEQIARTVVVSLSTVYRAKQRFVEGNLPWALSERSRRGAEPESGAGSCPGAEWATPAAAAARGVGGAVSVGPEPARVPLPLSGAARARA